MSVQKTAEAVRADKPSWRSELREEWNRRKGNTLLICTDVLYAALSFLFTRCHLLFGAYPLGIAQLAALSHRVWLSLPGAVLGALSMGRAGIVYALTSVITVLLRVAVSGTGQAKAAERTVGLFREGRLLRSSAAVIGGFICAVYEVLLSGLSLTTVLYGATMTLAAGVLCYLLSGWDACDITVRELILGEAPLFDGIRCRRCELRASVEFQLALCAYVFFITYALTPLSIFGISFAYAAAAAVTLLAARRFGPLRAMAVGFVAVLGLSPIHAVSYALGGLCAGLLYSLGAAYALIGSVCVVGAWSALSAGLAGFVATVPEYAIAAALFFPLSRRLTAQVRPEQAVKTCHTATDMVGTMALTYRSQTTRAHLRLEQAIASLSPILQRLCEHRPPDAAEYRRLLEDVLADVSRDGAPVPMSPAAAEPMLDTLSERLAGGEPLTEQGLLPLGGDAAYRRAFLAAFGRRHGAWQAERFRRHRADEEAELCEVIAKMMNEVRVRDEREQALDAELSRRLTEIFEHHGFPGGVIRAYGDRRKYILAAGEDAGGERITSDALFSALEEACGVRLDKPSFFRKDAMVLMECRSRPRYRVRAATASAARTEEEVSGDSVSCFEGTDGCCYLVLSDGMGSGEAAHRTSEFSVDYLSRMMGSGCSEGTALFLLNQLIRGRAEECSATVDMFVFDLILGEGQFYKSGAAASYIKRGSSLFRIRSQTAPVGLLRSLDAERIKVEVQPEDLVILLSDGISGAPEDDPWLVELLNRPHSDDLQVYAEHILNEARAHVQPKDDMTVLVARITAA